MAIQWERLKEPFEEHEIEFRIGRSGETNGKVWATCLAYVTARAIQERLDEVFGPGGWKNEYREGPAGGVLCRIWFKNDDGEWVWREDGAGDVEASRGLSASDAQKGTYSAAMKRAGSALGIGRFLYALDEGFAEISDNGNNRAKTKEGKSFRWNPPKLPAWALPLRVQVLPKSIEGLTGLLDYIRNHAPKVGRDAVLTLGSVEHNFREYVQANWPTIVSTPSVAEAVAKVVETETGVPRDG